MRAIAIAPIRNTSGKKDATGAFQPEAKRFSDYCRSIGIECKDYLLDIQEKDCFFPNTYIKPNIYAVFTHGTPRSVRICGKNFVDMRNYKAFVKEFIERAEEKTVYVGLYACLAGKELAKAMAIEMSKCPVKFRIIAHTTRGHTTYNPYVIRFTERDLAGSFICQPGSPEWKEWRRRLREDKDLRFRILFEDTTK